MVAPKLKSIIIMFIKYKEKKIVNELNYHIDDLL